MPALLALALVLGAHNPVDVAAAEQQAFKGHVLAGEQLYAQGEFGPAIWHFRQAEALRPTPEIAFNLAKAHGKIGDEPMEAYYYRLYMRRAPQAKDALEVAEILGDLLSRAEADGRGLLEIDAPEPGRVELDGHTWVALPVATFLPPGDYAVVAHFDSGVIRKALSVHTGEATTLHLEPTLPPLLDADGPASPVSLSGGPAPSGRTLLHWGSMGLLGAGVAALAAGVAFGAASASDVGRLGSEKGALTVSEANQLAHTANGHAGTANLLFGLGGAGVLAGGALFAFTLPEPGGAK